MFTPRDRKLLAEIRAALKEAKLGANRVSETSNNDLSPSKTARRLQQLMATDRLHIYHGDGHDLHPYKVESLANGTIVIWTE